MRLPFSWFCQYRTGTWRNMIFTELEKQEFEKYTKLYDFRDCFQGKTFLITGSKGIVGSGLMKWLLYENQYHNGNVRVIASTRDKQQIPDYIEDKDNVIFCTFGKEKEECEKECIDYIVHAAAPTSNKVFLANPVESMNVIIDGTKRMLELARGKGSSMIYISSEEVYGTPHEENPISEDFVGAIDSLSIRSCYPLGKKAAELFCKSYSVEYGVNVSIIRPTVILGLWQPYDSVKVEAEILRCILENKNLVMKSDGSTKKSVVYSLDVVSALLMVLIKGNAGEAYNITNPDTFRSVRETAESMFRKYNDRVTIEYDIDPNSKTAYLPKRMLNENIQKCSELGWKPLADLEYIYDIDIKRFQD